MSAALQYKEVGSVAEKKGAKEKQCSAYIVLLSLLFIVILVNPFSRVPGA
jgi:hypothetical protein